MKVSFTDDVRMTYAEKREVILKNSIELKSINDLDSLLEEIGDAKCVLLGEASLAYVDVGELGNCVAD